ncbi:MAG: ABC transporter ATP-binding protein [Clostridia bacterium]|nr:ABC transporter ATP-binding protein [Clostridia bacterium]
MLINMKDAVKTYGDFRMNCSLELDEGRITGLIGRNGAGKSTAMGAILGLFRTESGEITVLGKRPQELMPDDRRRIGVTLSEGGFSEYLKAEAIASVYEAMYPGVSKEKFLEMLRKNSLPADKQIREYSKGMKAKFRLICAICHAPDLLVLDEPTSGLDVLARDEVLDMLRDYMAEKEGRGILISSHISSDLEGLCDDLYFIDGGKVVLHEDTDRLLGKYGLIKADDRQFEALDMRYIIKKRRESYGYACLTDNRQFYQDNYPDLVIEPGSIDNVITMVIKGEDI